MWQTRTWIYRFTTAATIAVVFASTVGRSAELPQQAALKPSAITIQKVDEGFVFGNEKGMALYTFDQDVTTPGSSACTFNKSCAWRWPPVYASDDASPVGDWTIIKRPDLSRQWAYKNKPVYTYRDDLSPGVISGDNGQGGLWHAVMLRTPAPKPLMPAGFQVKRVGDSWVYVDYDGRELYSSKATKTGKVSCNANCLRNWTPVPAAALAHAEGDWAIIQRDDGSLQWTFNGNALYTASATKSTDAAEQQLWHTIQVAE